MTSGQLVLQACRGLKSRAGGFKSLSMTTNVPIVVTEAVDDEKAGNNDHAGRSVDV